MLLREESEKLTHPVNWFRKGLKLCALTVLLSPLGRSC
jgi:hypothetical protein